MENNIILVEMGNSFYTRYTKFQSAQGCTYAHRSACQREWTVRPNRKVIMEHTEIRDPIIYEIVDTHLLFQRSTYEILPETGIWFTIQE